MTALLQHLFAFGSNSTILASQNGHHFPASDIHDPFPYSQGLRAYDFFGLEAPTMLNEPTSPCYFWVCCAVHAAI